MTFEKNKIQTGSCNVTCTDFYQSGRGQKVHLLWTWARWNIFSSRREALDCLPVWCQRDTQLDNLILSRWPVRCTSPQLPGAQSRKSLHVPHIWSTKAGQISGCTPANVTGMCFLTQMTSFRLLFLSPLGERQGRDDGRQRSSVLSSPTPSHYFISLSPRNPSPVACFQSCPGV